MPNLFLIHFFYKNNFIKTRGALFSKCKRKLRTIPTSAEELKYHIVNLRINICN